ncbi:vitamin K-dependent protein S isoform X1 [Lepisosteus oculatus]|uniref:vitamin K-dependent protein S isoform X1 n=2 Tax=Lepisosteus oculatus TaxID=7918 RepID=UPI0035F5007B
MGRETTLWRASVGCLLFMFVLCDALEFLSQRRASQFLTRERRANYMLEESKKGNLERECIEEVCDREEAREIFENDPETEYFIPRYVGCLGLYRVGVPSSHPGSVEAPSDLRMCVTEISDQCSPLPCNKEGYDKCVDGKASYHCVCKPGWMGENCDEDVNECEDPDFLAGCNQKCFNFPGSFRCLCDDGYILLPDKITCKDINECILYPSICGPAQCVNVPGIYECKCPEGFKYNYSSKSCIDIDECTEHVCEGLCVNTVGSFSCYCDGRAGLVLSADKKSCKKITRCFNLNDYKSAEMLYLGEQFVGSPVLYLRFRLPENTKFAAEFDFRTFDPEGVILYAESSKNSWFMLGLRNGQIEVQFKNEHVTKVTSGGKAVNDGEWHIISLEELERSITVKISKEAVMNINSPQSLFPSVSGILETKFYIAGLPSKSDSLIRPINPRLDGCIRAWNFMDQGASGVREVIQEKGSKHCFVEVERGSYFPGSGLAQFDIDYSSSMNTKNWTLNLSLNIRPSSSTGVLFSLVSNNTVPLSVAVMSTSPDDEDISLFIEDVLVASVRPSMLCFRSRLALEVELSSWGVRASLNSSVSEHYAEQAVLQKQLSVLSAALQGRVDTYVGGVQGVPLSATPVTAFYNGCMEIVVNNRQLDFDEAISKHSGITSHSCPPV